MFQKEPEPAFSACFFLKLPMAQKLSKKIGSLKYFRRAQKVESVEMKN